jgi:hypothetical protein
MHAKCIVLHGHLPANERSTKADISMETDLDLEIEITSTIDILTDLIEFEVSFNPVTTNLKGHRSLYM